ASPSRAIRAGGQGTRSDSPGDRRRSPGIRSGLKYATARSDGQRAEQYETKSGGREREIATGARQRIAPGAHFLTGNFGSQSDCDAKGIKSGTGFVEFRKS